MQHDVYNLLLESLGYHSDLGISENDLIQNQEEISQLAKEIGIGTSQEIFDLFVVNDLEHDMIQAVQMIHSVSIKFGLEFENSLSKSLMYTIHYSGKARLATGSYHEMYQIQKVLNEDGFLSFIRKA